MCVRLHIAHTRLTGVLASDCPRTPYECACACALPTYALLMRLRAYIRLVNAPASVNSLLLWLRLCVA